MRSSYVVPGLMYRDFRTSRDTELPNCLKQSFSVIVLYHAVQIFVFVMDSNRINSTNSSIVAIVEY